MERLLIYAQLIALINSFPDSEQKKVLLSYITTLMADEFKS